MADIIETNDVSSPGNASDNEVNHVEMTDKLISDEQIETKARKTKEEKEARRAKKRQIIEALSQIPPDLDALKELATSEGGLLSDKLRLKVWPKFLNLDPYEVSPKPTQAAINSHPEYTQVDLDVQRCLRRFPPDIPKERRLALQSQLTCLIIRILIKHKELHYYQGYHDICVTFLLVLGEELAFACLEKLSITRLKLFMEPTMESTVKYLNYVGTIIDKQSPQLYKHLEKGEVSPLFCLSWLITWFGHVLNDYRRIVRLYDFFLCTHKLMPIYLASVIILHRQEKVLTLEPDMAILHHFLCNVPDDLPFESLVPTANDLILSYPPEKVIVDYEKAIKGEKGFYHQWIDAKHTNNTLTGFVWNKLASISNSIVPTFVQRNLFFAVSIIIPVVLAIGWYSVNFSKTQTSFFNNSAKKIASYDLVDSNEFAIIKQKYNLIVAGKEFNGLNVTLTATQDEMI